MKLNIVLDLDATLICTHPELGEIDEDDKVQQENPKHKYDKLKKMSFVASPFLREAGMIIEDKE